VAIMVRADAQRNIETIRRAAIELFRERGLDVPLTDVAARAGVTKGTIYHRFGGREGLIDAVIDDLVDESMWDIATRAQSLRDPWERFSAYLTQIWDLQFTNPAANDVLSRTYPDSTRLTQMCEGAIDIGARLVADAQRAGTLRADFRPKDLFHLVWATGTLIRAAPGQSREDFDRHCRLLLDGLRATG
jgi:AcrR family transcriptional regulator